MSLKGRIVVYSTAGCPHCKAAKAKLKDHELPFYEVDISTHKERRDEMITRTEKRTVPQIFFNNKHIGGNDELQKLSKEALTELIELLKSEYSPPEAPQPIIEDNKTHNEKAKAFDSLPDEEFTDLIKDIRADKSVVRTHRRMIVKTYNKTFTAVDFVTHLADKYPLEKAVEIGKFFTTKKLIISVSPRVGMDFQEEGDVLYQFLEDRSSKALNSHLPAHKKVASTAQVGLMLRKCILELYDEFLSSDGKKVDYDGMKTSAKFEEYVKMASQLQRLDVENISRNEKLAFFINIYNALVIHGNIEFGFPTSTLQRFNFFNNSKYVIGGEDYSLQDIENGVLRANRKGVGQLTLPFGHGDARLGVALKVHEPLIHFALVCGAKSCPPIKTYSTENVEEELQLAGSGFVEADENCSVDGKSVKLSMIFKWYSVDFGSNDQEVLGYIAKIMPDGNKKEKLSKLLDEKSFKVSYFTYNWDTNK